MNFSLEKNVEILSAYHVERFTHLRNNEQYQDADAIAQEYVCKGEVENDNYKWLYVNSVSYTHLTLPTNREV